MHEVMQTTTASAGDQEPLAQAAGPSAPAWPWIDFALPAQQEALAYDRLVQSRIDGHVLRLLRSGDTAAADSLYHISLGFVASQRDLQPRVFWQICAAFFQVLARGLGAVDADGKRALSGILLQYRALAAGAAGVSERLLRDLLSLLAQVEPAGADAPVLVALRQAYGLTGAGSAAGGQLALERFNTTPAEADSGAVELEERVKVIGTLRIGIAVFNAYLNEADEWSRRLFVELSEWALELHRPVAQSTIDLAHALAAGSAGVGLRALSELADALEHALRHVQAHAPGMPQHVQVFLQAAEDIRRLLHQFAAGFLKQPEQQLLSALGDIAHFEFPSVPEGADGALDAGPARQFAEQAAPMLLQLGGALRQWQARPDNVGARNEALRVLQTLENSSGRVGATHIRELSRDLRSGIEQLGMQSLQMIQLEPLRTAFDRLNADLDRIHAAATES